MRSSTPHPPRSPLLHLLLYHKFRPVPAQSNQYEINWYNAFYNNCYQASIINCGNGALVTRNCGVTFSATGAYQSIEVRSCSCARGEELFRSVTTSACQMTMA
ncbi:hypothetical protein BGZ82_004179, partial [Podila clonocystis]